MALKVLKADEANRDYENNFFREFSSNLVEMFRKEGLDGILIGHPSVPANKYLKPDCVLITENRLVLIDFKNHSGKIWLPDEASFDKAPWRHDGTIIRGGSSTNPFEQLKKQREWTEALIGENKYGRGEIACLVCFQGNMNVMNEVPGRFQKWFSVTNSYQYINRIRDIIGVRNDHVVDIEEIASYFEAKPYHDFHPVSFENIIAVSVANEKSAAAERAEHEAILKVEELEKKISKVKSEQRAATKLKDKLAEAKKEAEKAKKEAEKTLAEFDGKRHSLELETQKAIRAKADADKAKADEQKARTDALREQQKGKNRVIVSALILFGTLVVAIIGVGIYLNNLKIEDERREEEAQQIYEDYKNGKTCIPVEKAAEFIGSKSVCVNYYIGDIGENSYFIYLNKERYGNFQVIIPQNLNLITKQDAKTKFLNKRVEVRGTITEYNEKPQIKITDLGQIKIIE